MSASWSNHASKTAHKDNERDHSQQDKKRQRKQEAPRTMKDWFQKLDTNGLVDRQSETPKPSSSTATPLVLKGLKAATEQRKEENFVSSGDLSCQKLQKKQQVHNPKPIDSINFYGLSQNLAPSSTPSAKRGNASGWSDRSAKPKGNSSIEPSTPNKSSLLWDDCGEERDPCHNNAENRANGQHDAHNVWKSLHKQALMMGLCSPGASSILASQPPETAFGVDPSGVHSSTSGGSSSNGKSYVKFLYASKYRKGKFQKGSQRKNKAA